MQKLTGLFPTSRPANGKHDPCTLLQAAGYVKQISSGCWAFLPLGLMVLHKINQAFRESCSQAGFSEVYLPMLQKLELWNESGRITKYKNMLAMTTVGKQNFVINPTQEEAILDLFRSSGFKTSDLPVRIFQISERLRNELRPANGLMRTRSFVLGDIYSLTSDENSARNEVELVEQIFSHFLGWTGLEYQIGRYMPSILGAHTSSYWVNSPSKQFQAYLCKACGSSFRFTEKDSLVSPCCHLEMVPVDAIEIGDVMRSGCLFSEKMKVYPVNSLDKPVFVTMAGLGVGRLVQILAEKHSDQTGLTWPKKFSPFDCHFVVNTKRRQEAYEVSADLESLGYRVIIDDRDMSMGRQLVDCDLIGMPVRVVMSDRQDNGNLEVSIRKTRQVFSCDTERLINILKDRTAE